MDKSRLGEIIYFYRKHRKISQTKLGRGICSISTMSRIELGEMEVSMLFAQTLLERMGVTVNKFELISDEKDYRLYEKRCEIQSYIGESKFQEAYVRLNKYETLINKKDLLHQQFIALNRAKLIRAEGGKLNIVEALLNEAEAYTLNVTVKKRKDFLLYSQTEIDIILNKARIYMENGKIEEAQKSFFNLYKYMKYFNSKELQEKLLPEIQLEIAQIFYRRKGYGFTLEMVKDALESIKDSRRYQYVAELHFLYARALWQLSIERGCEEEVREECVRRCLQAYYLYRIDEDERKDIVLGYMEGELKWESTKWENL